MTVPEQITNGGFETGDMTGWTLDSATASVTQYFGHSGSYKLDMNTSGIVHQTLDIAVPVDGVVSFGFYYSAYGASFNVVITYSDTSTSTSDTISSESPPYAYYDITAILTAGKVITKITFNQISGRIYIDDVSLIGTGLGIKTHNIDTILANPPATWLTGWALRKSHVITAASGAGTDYQIPITVHYGSGDDGAGDVYVDGFCNTDFSDIRFTADDGVTELYYWMESITDSDNAVFWVRIFDDLSSIDRTIYMYYDNPSATTTTSDGNNTFTFPANPAFTNDGYDSTTYNHEENPEYTIVITDNPIINDNRGRLYLGDYWIMQYERCNWTWDYGSSASRRFFAGWFGEVTANPSYSADCFFTLDISPDNSTWTTIKQYELTPSAGSSDSFATEVQKLAGTYRYIRATLYSTSGGLASPPTNLWVYAVFVGKYVSPEPANGDWGPEEGGAGINNYKISTVFQRLGLETSYDIDILLASYVTLTNDYSIDVKIAEQPSPTSIDKTLCITGTNATLWTRPISWKESQDCNPAIRPVPLAESEYLDEDSWVLKPRTIECKIRLSDNEKDVLESIYNYPSTLPPSATNTYVGLHLYYDDSVYIWNYTVWIREKSYKFEYVYQDDRYVRWWIATLICDVQSFSGSSSTLPTWDDDNQSQTYGYTTYLEDSSWSIYDSPYYDPIAKGVKISDERLDHVLDFIRDDQHPPMIPNWVNQLAEVDSYLWNECVLDVSYRCRMTNAEKYHMDLLLQSHKKILYEDYIHNIFANYSPSGEQIINGNFEGGVDEYGYPIGWNMSSGVLGENTDMGTRVNDTYDEHKYSIVYHQQENSSSVSSNNVGLILGGIGIKGGSTSPTIYKGSQYSGTLEVDYDVAVNNSFVVIVASGGWYALDYVTPPVGPTWIEDIPLTNGSYDDCESVYIAHCVAHASGTGFAVTASGYGMSIAIYIFEPDSYTYSVTSDYTDAYTGSSPYTISLTLDAGYDFYIFAAGDGNDALIFPQELDVHSETHCIIPDNGNHIAIYQYFGYGNYIPVNLIKEFDVWIRSTVDNFGVEFNTTDGDNWDYLTIIPDGEWHKYNLLTFMMGLGLTTGSLRWFEIYSFNYDGFHDMAVDDVSLISKGTGAWISSVEARWDDTNWIKPWEVTIALQANNSETETRDVSIDIDSFVTGFGTDHLGTLYLDEGTSDVKGTTQVKGVGVHKFYYFLPDDDPNVTGFNSWQVTGDALILDTQILSGQTSNGQTFNGESILTVLIYGGCSVYAFYGMSSPVTFNSQLDGEAVYNHGFLYLDSSALLALPYTANIPNSIGVLHTITYEADTYSYPHDVFDHWESSANITITDPNSITTTFTLDSGSSGTITAIFEEMYSVNLEFWNGNPTGVPYLSTPISYEKGQVVIDGLSYFADQTLSLKYGSHTISYAPDYGFAFFIWTDAGGVSVISPTTNSTTMNVTDDGTLKIFFISDIIFHSGEGTGVNTDYWWLIKYKLNHDSTDYQTGGDYTPLDVPQYNYDDDDYVELDFSFWNGVNGTPVFVGWESDNPYITFDDASSPTTHAHLDNHYGGGIIRAVYIHPTVNVHFNCGRCCIIDFFGHETCWSCCDDVDIDSTYSTPFDYAFLIYWSDALGNEAGKYLIHHYCGFYHESVYWTVTGGVVVDANYAFGYAIVHATAAGTITFHYTIW